MAEDPAGATAGNPAAAREHIVIADARCMDADQHVVRAGFGAIDLGQFEHLRTAEVAERYRLHRSHASSAAGKCGRAFLVIVVGLNHRSHGFDFGALRVRLRRENMARRLVACTAAGE